MTERLSTLLREEAGELATPAAPTATILASGHRLRRRRRVAQVAGAGALALALAGGAALAVAGGGEDPRDGRAIDPATTAYLDHGAFATGSTVHLTGAGPIDSVDVGEPVKVLYYTSAGLLVRSGDTPWTDDPGPSRYSLVTPDGSLRVLDLELGDRVPATDPDQPVVAYAEAAGDGAWDVVVRDVARDEEVSRTTVDGDFGWGGWEAPPVELDGDLVYVGLDDRPAVVDWRAGRVVETPDGMAGSSVPSVAGGLTVRSGRGTVDVVDVATGDVVFSTPDRGYPYIDLSPDGRFAKVVVQDESEGDGFDVVDLGSGEVTRIDRAPWDLGWTPAGNLVSVDLDTGELTTCTVDGDACTTDPISGPTRGELKLAGLAYES